MLGLGTSLLSYYQERFKPFPWLLLPFVLSALFLGHFDRAFWEVSLYLAIALVFFRLFDDLGSRDYDLMTNKSRRYFGRLEELQAAIFLPFGLLLALTFFWMGTGAAAVLSLFILASGMLYLVFSPKKSVLLVSLLKYPFLGAFILEDFTPWIGVVFALFLFHELVEEKIIAVSRWIPLGLFITATMVRFFGSTWL